MEPGVVRERTSAGNPFRDRCSCWGATCDRGSIIAFVLAALYAIGFALARVPWWPLIAVVGGFATFIPRVGSLIPLISAAMTIGWVDWNLEHFLFAFAAWLLIQALEGFLYHAPFAQ